MKRYNLTPDVRAALVAVAESVTGLDPRPFCEGTDDRGTYLDLTALPFVKAQIAAAIERRRAASPEAMTDVAD